MKIGSASSPPNPPICSGPLTRSPCAHDDGPRRCPDIYARYLGRISDLIVIDFWLPRKGLCPTEGPEADTSVYQLFSTWCPASTLISPPVKGIANASHCALEKLLKAFDQAYDMRCQRVPRGASSIMSCEVASRPSQCWRTRATMRSIQALCLEPTRSLLPPRGSCIQTY
jgi:hypothetical protein